MATYVILNIVFTVVVMLLLFIGKIFTWNKIATATLLITLVCTAIFDSLIVKYGVVAYDKNLILGINIGRAPIEDFFYTLLVVPLMVSLWNYFERKEGKND